MSSPTPISDVPGVAKLAALATVVKDLCDEPIHPTQLRAALAAIAKLRNQLEALELGIIERADATGQWGLDGSRSPKAWVERATHCSAPMASAKLRNARILSDIPELAAVLASGEATSEHISVLSRAAVGSDIRRKRVGEVDSTLARLAPGVRPGEFGVAVATWAHRVDAIGAGEDYAARTAERTHLHVSRTLDGLVAVDGVLDPETGAAFIDALAATRAHLRRREPAPQNPVPTSESPPSYRDDGVTTNQPRQSAQNIDALRHLLGLALTNSRMPSATGGLPVQIVVTTDIESLRSDLWVRQPDSGRPPSPDPLENGNPDRRTACGPTDLNGHGTGAHMQIPAASARRLACDADILPVVMNSKSQVLDLGRRTRLISPALRLAVELRDKHCRWPDCQANIQEIHHVVFWANGGATDQDNLAGLCRAHHHSVHERGFTLTGNANHRLELRNPR